MSPVLESSLLSPKELRCNPNPLLASQETQMKPNGTTHVTIPPEDGESSKIYPAGLLSRLKSQARRWAVLNMVLILILTITVITLIVALIALSAKKSEPCSAGPACPDGWIRYLGKCYYFSQAAGDWTDSQNNCSALGASLTVIDTQQEMDFLLRYRGRFYHWIGLRREPDQPWMWTNGTEFNNWFTIVGGGLCAFADNDEIASSGCSRAGHWICSKPAEKPEGRAK
ncbi:early activation antigen CD69 isoform X2 [Chelonia mydas]|uniref:early activation antigen CD69 isoform X2 n=1 Tax=Chelonia mydas TaxID=8469 RepID=UPI0018A1ED21|nr:early activation antigen CD69 isoform X2 [Chelonia mydas]